MTMLSGEEPPPSGTPGRHHRVMSSLDDLSLLMLDHPTLTRGSSQDVQLNQIEVSTENPLPKASLLVVTETQKLQEENSDSQYLVSSLSDIDFSFTKLKVRDWDLQKQYSDYIKEGLQFKGVNIDDYPNVVMLFESPSSAPDTNTFHNKGT